MTPGAGDHSDDLPASERLRQDAHAERRAPICRWCGVTALPGAAVGLAVDFACDNPDCPAVGERVR